MSSFNELINLLDTFENDQSLSHYSDQLIRNSLSTPFLVSYSQFYYILNLKEKKIEFIGGNLETLTGYLAEETSWEFLYQIVHPEDLATVVKATKASLAMGQLRYKQEGVWRIDFRIKKKNGQYIRVLREVGVLKNDDLGFAVLTWAILTDITNIKKSTKITYEYIGPLDILYDGFDGAKRLFSAREIEVLNSISLGISSKRIADQLNISLETVKSHRKNMLQKANCKTSSQLIRLAIKLGILAES